MTTGNHSVTVSDIAEVHYNMLTTLVVVALLYLEECPHFGKHYGAPVDKRNVHLKYINAVFVGNCVHCRLVLKRPANLTKTISNRLKSQTDLTPDRKLVGESKSLIQWTSGRLRRQTESAANRLAQSTC